MEILTNFELESRNGKVDGQTNGQTKESRNENVDGQTDVGHGRRTHQSSVLYPYKLLANQKQDAEKQIQ